MFSHPTALHKNTSYMLNVICDIRAISHLLQEITRREGGRKKSPTQHVKTCVRFRHRQGHPLLVSPRCFGSVTGSGAGRRQTCFCHSRGARLVYMAIVFTPPHRSLFVLVSFPVNLSFTCEEIQGVVRNYAQL